MVVQLEDTEVGKSVEELVACSVLVKVEYLVEVKDETKVT